MDVKSIPKLSSSGPSAAEAKAPERGNAKTDDKNQKRRKPGKPDPEKKEETKNVTTEPSASVPEPGQILDSQKVVELLSHRPGSSASRADAFSKNVRKPAPAAVNRKKLNGSY